MQATLRKLQEEREHEYMSPYASFSDQSLGRDRQEEECDIRPIYQRDRDRILHCKAFRRLNSKTQVFLTPNGDHYRTRLTHTLEVAQTSRTIARALRLNEDLVEAIALGHDLGHTPFGHAGERALNKVFPGGFQHNEQSIRVVEKLEKNGMGLNLTKEVRDGILNHSTRNMPFTLEGKIVRLADKFAYVNHDIDDAIRGKILEEKNLPSKYTDILGHNLSQRLNTLIHDVVVNSDGKNDIALSDSINAALYGLRDYLNENLYTNSAAKSQETKAMKMVQYLYDYYKENVHLMPDEYVRIAELEGPERAACDYVAGMTDKYSVAKYKELILPDAWDVY